MATHHRRDGFRSVHRVRVGVIARTLLDRECLVNLLASKKGFSARDLGEPTEETVRRGSRAMPDVILLDLDARDALPFIDLLLRQIPRAQILVVLRTQRPEDALRLAESGATGFLDPEIGVRGVKRSIQMLGHAGSSFPRSMTRMLIQASRHRSVAPADSASAGSSLTHRERQILALMAEGISNKEIADRLCIGFGTAKNHVHRVLGKLGIKHRWDVLPADTLSIRPWSLITGSRGGEGG